MKRKFFIKLAGIVCAVTLIASLFGCADNAQKQESSSSKEVSISADIKEDKFNEYVERLGFLLTSPDWKNVTDISPANYVMWYAAFIQNQHQADDMYMSKYLVDDKDGFFFPADEFESVVTKYFDISMEHLRSDAVIYHEEEKLYSTSSALKPLAETSFDITNVIESEEKAEIEFILNTVDSSQKKALTLKKAPGGWNYVSFVSK